jgi:ribosomal protein S12 methylthiotransferase accessory factor
MVAGGPGDRLIGFRRHLRVEVVPGDAVYVFSEDSVTALRGPHIEYLAPLLDGSRDLATLRRELPPGANPEQVAADLAKLGRRGLVALRAPAGPDTDPLALAYQDACGVAPGEAEPGRIALITAGVEPGPALDALRAAGLKAEPGTGPADLSVVLCDDYLADDLAGIDAEHRAAGRPWLLARPAGPRVWLGPVFTPGDGPCWHCLATRLRANRPVEAHVRTALGLPRPVAGAPATVPALTAVALNLVALDAGNWLAGHRHPGQRHVWIFDSRDLTGRHHEIRARPQCASCGDSSIMRRQARRPVVLGSRPKAHTTGGGHRAVPPERILDTYRHLVSPVTGVVKEIRRDTRGPVFLNAFRSGPNLALGARGAEHLRGALRQENGGKGVTPVDAEVSALAEGLERHSAWFEGDEERVRASFDELGSAAVHPDTCQLFHPRQYPDRARWNAAHAAFQYVCDPFDSKAVLDWTPVWSLTGERERLLPTGLLYFGGPAGHGPVYVRADSNGNAAGTTLEDAVLQGMLELVERDAVAIWWYNRTRAPGVALDAFGDPWLTELQDVYAGLAREVWVLDVTSDLGVPVMVAVSRRTGGPREDIIFGFGAHLDPVTALRRALTELNQLLPAVLTEESTSDDPDARRWWAHATVAKALYLVPDPSVPQREPADYGYAFTADIADDIASVRARLEAAGLEVLVLDQTRPDIGLPVVKVIVPGLRGFWARFAPGRLYDVPVRLGRLARPTGYEDLNPMPLFL